MKKYVEWIRSRIKNTLKFEALNNREVGFKISIKETLELINQLDESEVLSQKSINKHEIYIHDSNRGIIKAVPLVPNKEITEKQVIDWLDNNEFYDHITAETVLERAVDKGELSYYGTKYSVIEAPIIPKYMAEYLEFAKNDVSLTEAMEFLNENGGWPPMKKEYDWFIENQEKFMRAWLNGYTMEKEE